MNNDINNYIYLTKLYLNKNNININFILNEIKFLTNLKDLNLSFNKINTIPIEIKYLTNLKILKLSINEIKEIPEEITLGKNNYLHIYPNPAAQLLNVKIQHINHSSFNIIEIYDMQGKLIKQIKNIEADNSIDVSSFSKGSFILSLKNKKGELESKVFVIE